jgi:fumarate hydratase class II
MPGKVNPTQSEALIMICHQVFGNDTAITISGASGNFELNVCQPVILHNFLQSVRLLAGGMAAFAQYGIEGIVANVDRISDLMHASLMLVTALTPHIGYDRSAEIARAAYQRNISLKEAAVASGHLSADQFDAWVRPERFV